MVGYDILRVGTDVRIPADADILAFATSEKRILITHDQDFGELVFNKGLPAPYGVVVFRYEPASPDEVAKRLMIMLRSGLYTFAGFITAVDEGKVRQRAC